ncbi:MAG: SUF system Fe-S cluster assembly protein [Pseudomonadota bacterium]
MTDMQTDTDETFDPETGGRDIIDLSAPAEEKPAEPEAPRGPRPELTEVEMADITQAVIKALKTVYDPEIPVDIYELGLIYKVDYDPATEKGGKLTVDMTLTAPGCPVAGEMPGWVEDAVLTVDGVDDVSVNMTFEPPWSPERMSEEARLELGWM